MNYLLTREELDQLVPKKILDQCNDTFVVVRKMLLRAHNIECIHDDRRLDYCDNCPCSSNLGKLTWEQSKILCPLERSYSQ